MRKGFNHKAPCAVKRAELVDDIMARIIYHPLIIGDSSAILCSTAVRTEAHQK